MNQDLAVELRGVVKRFGGKPAVDNLDLGVPRGSVYGFIGPNGSGKTTTMRLILRIYQPEEGEVTVLGRSGGNSADHRVGYLPEERGLYQRMKVRRVLRYFAQLKGLRRPDALIEEQLARLEATEWAEKRIEQLSKGMAQKIQFIVATITKPELLILDEPFSGLDPVNLSLLRKIVLDLRDQGTTVIFSTHDMGVAQELCDRVFMIYRGKKVLDGTIDEVRRDHARCQVRVRMANGASLPESIPGIVQRITAGADTVFELEQESSRSTLLNALAAVGDVEHFETIRPSLHDVFVRIARPNEDTDSRAEENPDG